ncbi:hypothetical protein BDV95DRAFT_557520 [Massariosphaeria phaeospora]|uniref:F-box domain-containing protein n=1 Tax=Massariosphaeria phaeospora TaxID=100035 RepID=A0A7C8MIS0_9PLEO|nr:hypothetical protein BDV95DRAFT_557520 [Massariosphaeria phaeospora]
MFFVRGRKPGTGPLLQLSTEIIEAISAYLSIDALENLRLACRELEYKTQRHIGRTYFQAIKFMPSRYALKVLVALSKSRMARYVKTLALGPPSNDLGFVRFPPGNNLSTASQSRIESNMFNYSEENRMMRTLGEDAGMINTALQNLHGITKLVFLDPSFNSCHPTPSPSGSYGEHYLHEKVGAGSAKFDTSATDATQSMARLFLVTLHAAESAALPVQCITMKLTMYAGVNPHVGSKTSGFASHPLYFPTARLDHGISDDAWAHLSVLRLHIGHRDDVWQELQRGRFVERTIAFLSRAPALHTLGLTMMENHGLPTQQPYNLSTIWNSPTSILLASTIYSPSSNLFEVLYTD